MRLAVLSFLPSALLFVAPTAAVAASHDGKVVATDVDQRMITVAPDAGKEESFELSATCEIKLNGKEATLADLGVGAFVTVTTTRVDGKEIATKIVARSAARSPAIPSAYSGS